ncbi:hypothetical protein CJ030_MR2G007301 [Morella rubra]|uniref:Uncharacterized protein n=1 Tax=Morella rubra TaxID=262757 RepID=A0A6A1WCN0_9ROSI|nr:hypothetical protein CJ030_MR2G007301 [Morella rubra]
MGMGILLTEMTEMKPIPRGGPMTGDGTVHNGIVQATTERIVVGIPSFETRTHTFYCLISCMYCHGHRTYQMLTFMSEQTLDVDPYIVVVKLWTYVTESFEVFVGYEPQWYLKDPPASLPRIEDFGLVDVDLALLNVVPPPPARQ